MELGHPGRRGQIFPEADPAIRKAVGEAAKPHSRRPAPRETPPETAGALGAGGAAPLSASLAGDAGHDGHQPLRHLHDEIQRRASARRSRSGPSSPRCIPTSRKRRLQGILEIIHSFDLILRELSGMDQFVFQAGGGADAAYTHCCVTRAYHQAKRPARRARRDHHLDPGPSLQCGDRRGRRLQGRDPAARGERLSLARRRSRPRSPTAPRPCSSTIPTTWESTIPTSRNGSGSSMRRADSASTTTPISTA